ncbi:hypothetical protein MKW92_032633 [Papaver armeniacum]|nr:hypothetical protein MKW92_032633 [Papaver armeniacum]
MSGDTDMVPRLTEAVSLCCIWRWISLLLIFVFQMEVDFLMELFETMDDILQACRNISHKVKDGLVKSEYISEILFNKELGTSIVEFPYPDLLIRTGGELRLSNFLACQLAYSELYFTESLWPDFGEREFIMALQSFQRRQKRFGGQHEEN